MAMDKIKEQQILQKLREANDRLVKAVQNGDWAKIAIYQQVRDKIQSEYDDIIEAKQFKLQTDNQDKALTSWGGQILSLSTIEADMSLYHLDLYMAYFASRNYIMKPEWYNMYEELKRALKKFADFNRKLFVGKNREQYDKDLIDYTDWIEHNFFTDREMIYYRKFEEKATSTIDELLSEKENHKSK